MKAWHFVGKTLRDGSPVPKDGEKLVFKGKPVLCKRGLHASRQPFDALEYAPGETLCYVECGGEIIESTDKLVCTERTILYRMDATEMLRYFARMQALSVIHLYPNDTDDAVFDYLMTGNDYLRDVAWASAWDVTEAAAGVASAASAAAENAAWAAGAAAANAAAARAAANAAAGVAAGAAANATARADFNSLAYECFGLEDV